MDSPITMQATVTLVSSTKRDAQHQHHLETIRRHRQGFGRRVEICEWDVTQFGRRPKTDKTARRSTQARLRDVVNVRARFRQENLSSALRDEEKVCGW